MSKPISEERLNDYVDGLLSAQDAAGKGFNVLYPYTAFMPLAPSLSDRTVPVPLLSGVLSGRVTIRDAATQRVAVLYERKDGNLGLIGSGVVKGAVIVGAYGVLLAGSRGDTRSQHLEDLYWVLVNSTEFSWNH